MQCALCLTDAKLCNSHIVPEFIFKRLYGKDHEFYALHSEGEAARKFYKSFSEKLLCSKCESQFSRWEGYASKFFYGGMPLTGTRDRNLLILEGVDYTQLKLFFMSLLWRFAVTTNPFFKTTGMGPHDEKLRLLLLSSNPKEPWRYGCSVTAVLYNGKHIGDLIVAPSVCKVWGHHCYRIVVGGFVISYFVTSHSPPAQALLGLIQPDGRFVISAREITDIAFLAQAAENISKQQIEGAI